MHMLDSRVSKAITKRISTKWCFSNRCTTRLVKDFRLSKVFVFLQLYKIYNTFQIYLKKHVNNLYNFLWVFANWNKTYFKKHVFMFLRGHMFFMLAVLSCLRASLTSIVLFSLHLKS